MICCILVMWGCRRDGGKGWSGREGGYEGVFVLLCI